MYGFFPFPGSGRGSCGKIFLFLPAGTWNTFFLNSDTGFPGIFLPGSGIYPDIRAQTFPKALPGSHPGSEGSFSALSILPDPV